MATFSKRMKDLRKQRNITLDDLAIALNTTKATLSRYENDLRTPNIDFIRLISDYFKVQVDYLLGRSDVKNSDLLSSAYIPKRTVQLPVLGVVRAGEPIFAEQNILGYYSIDAKLVPSGECFYLRVIGDSMNQSNIVNGQLVIIRRQDEVENGEIALILVEEEEATIKKFYKTDTIATLMPHSSNPDHQPKTINLKNDRVKIIGKVVGTFIRF
jgi:repressor LexA